MAILKEAPEGAPVLDLGAVRAARQEARAATGAATPVIKLAVGYVELNPEFDVMSAEDFATGNIRGGLSRVLADPADIDELIKGGLSRDDLKSIMEFVTGTSEGE
jgi:hypothetical protein